MIGWILAAISIIATVLNIRKQRICFFMWAVTNASWAVIDYTNGIYSQAFLFAVYFCLSIYGIMEWRSGKR